MKHFRIVIFVMIFAFSIQGDAKKVCILYEQNVVPTSSILSEDSIQNEILAVKEEYQISDVTDELSGITEEGVTEENTILVDVPVIRNSDIKATTICALEGITLFDDQNDLLRRMCTMTSAPSSLYVVTVQNSIVQSDLSLATLCAEGPKGLLSWIQWHDFIDTVAPLLSEEQLPNLVVRNLSIGVGNESESFSEVLIEVLPISYKLLNLKPSAWNNNTFIKTVLLGNIELENSNDTDRHIEGDLSYSFPIETNITFLSGYPIKGLPVDMCDATDTRKNFIVGSTNTYRYNNTFSVERLVPAFKKETVSLKGTFGLHEYDIEGTIISIFGVNTDGSIIEESHTISARVVTLETYDIKDSYYLEEITTTTTEEPELTTSEELPIAIPRVDGPVYPGFKNVFYVAVVLFVGTLIIAMIDVGRKLRRDRIAKKQGRREYMKIVPKF